MIKGLGRDVRVTVGQANTIHECVAPANPPNFHHRITKSTRFESHHLFVTIFHQKCQILQPPNKQIYGQAKSISDNYARSTKYLKFIKLVWVTGGQS